MNTPAEENLFSITLSQEGANNMLRTYRFYRWIFAAITVMSILFLITSFMRYINYHQYSTHGSLLYFLELRVSPLFWFFSTLIMIMQNYYFFRFISTAQKGIDLGQAEIFNASLGWLAKSAVVGLSLSILDLLSAVFYFYLEWRNILDGPPPA